jgi:membrane protein
MSVIDRLDRFQRNHRRAGLPIAVIYKFVDDQGNYLAALVTYYGFLAIVPLLLLSSTILNFVLEGHPDLQRRVFDSALGQFPIVGTQLAEHSVSGSGIGLAVGILGTLYGGLGVAQAAQNAMNTVWRVPRNSRPNPLRSRLRSLLLLLVVGLAVLATTALVALGSTADLGGDLEKVLLGIGTLALNTAVFTVAFRVATARDLGVRETLPGAFGAALAWQGLQYGGTAYVQHVVRHASDTNGLFALVLGLIAWIYLESVIVVFAVEFNTVRTLKLYPRALLTPFTDDVELTAADEASYTAQAKAQRQKGFQEITVSFDEPED